MSKKWVKRVIILVSLLTAIIFCCTFFTKRIKQVVRTASFAQVESYIYDSINITTDRIVVSNQNNALVELTKDDNGLVRSLSIDTEKVNILSNEVAVKCQADLSNSDNSLILHLGAFTGSTLLANRGRTVNVPMKVNYTVKSDFKTFGEKIGINVVRYALYLAVTTRAKIVLPQNTEEAEFVTYILVTETVFTCEIPDTFVASEEGLNYLDLIP